MHHYCIIYAIILHTPHKNYTNDTITTTKIVGGTEQWENYIVNSTKINDIACTVYVLVLQKFQVEKTSN